MNAPSTSSDSTQQISSLSRKEIFRLLKGNLNDGVTVAYKKIEDHLSKKLERSFMLSKNAKAVISNLLYKLKIKWQEVMRIERKFLTRNQQWLNVIIYFDEKKENESQAMSSSNKGHMGCQEPQFAQRTKRRRTEDIRSQSSIEESSYVTHMKLRTQGNVEAAKIVKDISLSSSSKARKYRRSLELIPEVTLSADEAVSLIIEQKLSRSQYQGLRNISVKKKCKLYPSYKLVLKAKCKCYPEKESINICETSAEVKLQTLLNHTINRILKIQMDVIKSLTCEQLSNLNLICKWGCDDSSGLSIYKQKFSDDDGSKSDANIFFTSLVPLQLISIDKKTSAKIIVWKNPRTSSPRFCRPIKIEFLHETTEATVKQTEYIKEQVSKLIPFNIVIDGKEITVNYELALTVIDGKVCNAITDTASTGSTQHCYLCNATFRDFNNMDIILKKEINRDSLSFGLSTLHMWIRLFECCLNISYKIDIKKWQAQGSEEEKAIENRKKNIQKGFRQQLGLIVDEPKSGFGNTNDGNTARRFFENAFISAAITGIDEDLIKRFHIILQAISSGHEIKIPDFQEYTIETARKFIDLYPWFYMPISVHKLLIHGSEIIQSALLPIGQMSEDAQESCNKYIKRCRKDFAGKCSRIKSMEDLFLRLLAASDPYISSLRKLPQKKLKSLFSETIALLTLPTLYVSTADSVSSFSMSSDSSGFDTDNSTDDEE